MLGLHADT